MLAFTKSFYLTDPHLSVRWVQQQQLSLRYSNKAFYFICEMGIAAELSKELAEQFDHNHHD